MNTMPMKCIEKDGICHTPGECPVHCRIIDEQIDEGRSLVAPIDAKALPPDPEGQNGERAEWADEALRCFQARTGTDFEDVLPDLLANLMHWADRNGVEFRYELDKARVHYEEETREQGAGMIIALPNDGRGLRYCIIDLLGRTVHEYRDLDAALRAREGDQRIAIWQEMNAQVGLEGRWLTGWPVPDPRS